MMLLQEAGMRLGRFCRGFRDVLEKTVAGDRRGGSRTALTNFWGGVPEGRGGLCRDTPCFFSRLGLYKKGTPVSDRHRNRGGAARERPYTAACCGLCFRPRPVSAGRGQLLFSLGGEQQDQYQHNNRGEYYPHRLIPSFSVCAAPGAEVIEGSRANTVYTPKHMVSTLEVTGEIRARNKPPRPVGHPSTGGE